MRDIKLSSDTIAAKGAAWWRILSGSRRTVEGNKAASRRHSSVIG